MSRCPCLSGLPYDACYSAFAVGDVTYLQVAVPARAVTESPVRRRMGEQVTAN